MRIHTREGVLVSLGSGLTMRATVRTTWSKVWIALVLLVVTAAQGERLYERDGITLEGTVRMVARDAATCQVREDDALHAGNDGKPLHVWRLDYGAFNGSGNPLSQLTAHFRIESEWPPCTNWTGLGQYPGPVQWAGSFETIQCPGGLEAGGEVRETLYVLAIDGQEPRFRNWQLDYRFGEVTVPSEPVPADPPRPSVPPLPEPRCEGMAEGAECWKQLSSRDRCYVWQGYHDPNDIVTWTGICSNGLASGFGTLTWASDGEKGTGTGPAKRGRADGNWTHRFADGSVGEGSYVDGTRSGTWTFRYPNGQFTEGPYLDGELHGTWITRFPDGTTETREFVHGERVD